MTDRDEQPSLDALVAALEGSFPAQSELPLAITLLRLLAEGRPVSAAALADAAGRGPAATGACSAAGQTSSSMQRAASWRSPA